MGRRRKDEDIDWRSVFRSYFSHDGAVGTSSDSPAAKAPAGLAPDVPPTTSRDPVGLGPDVPPAASKNPVGLGPDVPPAASNTAPVGLGLDAPPPAPEDVHDFSPMDEDEQGGHVSPKHCSELRPKTSGKKKNDGQLPMNKGKSKEGSVAKRKPFANKRRARATDPEESDYESTLPHTSFKRRKEQLQNSQKVQDVVILDDEDMEPKEEVNREMSDRLNEPKIYYPSRDDQEAVEITRSDIKCLDPEAFLSSPVINFYIKYIKRTRLCNENFRDKFYIFNIYFFGKLEEALRQPRDYPKLRRWWKGVNIFNNAYLILPIHERAHWSLVIICLPPKEGISEPIIILHLDSLGMHRSARILNTVGRYLEREWDCLSVAEAALPCLLSDIHKKAVQVPRQNNGYDSGIFMLYYIEQFIKEAPARFTIDKLGMFNRSWFKPEDAYGLRHRIKELLLEEFESVRLNDAISKADASKRYDSIKEGELEANDNSKMVVEVGVRLGNTIESNGAMKVVPSEEASGESGDAIKSTRGIKFAASQEASEESRDAGKIIEGVKVAASKEASAESGDDVKSTGGIKVATSQGASKNSRDVGKIIEGMKVEETSEESGDAVKSTGGIKVEASQETSEELGDAVKSAGGVKFAASQETSEESRNASKSIKGINVVESEETLEVPRDIAKSLKGINVAESDEASEESGDTRQTIKAIKVEASEEADIESGYAASMEDNADVVVQNKGPTSNKKWNKNNAGCVLPKATSRLNTIKDKKGTVKTYSGGSESEKQGKSNVIIASPERLKGTEKVMGSTPIPDAASDSGVKRSEENEEATTGSIPITDLVWETTGATVRITKIYRRTSGTTLEPGNWCWSSGGSSKNARKSFIEHFCRKK